MTFLLPDVVLLLGLMAFATVTKKAIYSLVTLFYIVWFFFVDVTHSKDFSGAYITAMCMILIIGYGVRAFNLIRLKKFV